MLNQQNTLCQSFKTPQRAKKVPGKNYHPSVRSMRATCNSKTCKAKQKWKLWNTNPWLTTTWSTMMRRKTKTLGKTLSSLTNSKASQRLKAPRTLKRLTYARLTLLGWAPRSGKCSKLSILGSRQSLSLLSMA